MLGWGGVVRERYNEILMTEKNELSPNVTPPQSDPAIRKIQKMKMNGGKRR